MSSVFSYAEVIEHDNICSMLALAEGILLSIYCMGCRVLSFQKVWMESNSHSDREYKAMVITLRLIHICPD